MVQVNERVLALLEFDKIAARVRAECMTPYGRELAERAHPLATHDMVLRALDETEEAGSILRLKGSLPFARTMDIRPVVGRAARGAVASAAELLAVAVTSAAARRIFQAVAGAAEQVDAPRLQEYAAGLATPKDVEDEVLSCLDEDALLRDRASPELYRLRKAITGAEERIKKALDELLRSAQMQRNLQDHIVTVRGDHYCLAIKAEHQNHVRGVVHDVSASGQTVFIEPERVLQAANEKRRLLAEEERESERILAHLSSRVGAHEALYQSATQALGAIDYAAARAHLARRTGSVRPLVAREPRLHIRGGRHPLLDQEAVVPLDVRLGGDAVSLVITGPNTGGKTVVLKTVGLLALMALCGFFIPAVEGTEIGFFMEIYADIGDEQSIEQSLSTFSSHMTHIVDILRSADNHALVLLDEVGAGTDPTEGAALAMAILERLRQLGAHTLATTHYSELKAYAYTTPGVTNASVEFDAATLAPTYRLLMGVPGRSNAFAIARRLGLAEEIIDDAESRLSTHDIRVEDLICRLQESVSAARTEEEALRETRLAAQRVEGEWLARQRAEREERDERRRRANDELRRYVRGVEREADELLRELRTLRERATPVKEHELSDVMRRLRELAPAQILHTPASQRRTAQAFEPGDEVRVLPLAGQVGTVVEAGQDGTDLLVALGAMKMKVGRDSVELLRRAPKKPQTSAMFQRVADDVKPTLDMRGARVEEAIAEVDRYLDRALVAGYPMVTIIHGKGTGALRSALETYLRGHPHVRQMRPGGEREGGSGVTVVTLGEL